MQDASRWEGVGVVQLGASTHNKGKKRLVVRECLTSKYQEPLRSFPRSSLRVCQCAAGTDSTICAILQRSRVFRGRRRRKGELWKGRVAGKRWCASSMFELSRKRWKKERHLKTRLHSALDTHAGHQPPRGRNRGRGEERRGWGGIGRDDTAREVEVRRRKIVECR